MFPWIVLGFWCVIFVVVVASLLYVVNAEAKEKAEKTALRDARFANLRERKQSNGHRR